MAQPINRTDLRSRGPGFNSGRDQMFLLHFYDFMISTGMLSELVFLSACHFAYALRASFDKKHMPSNNTD